MPSSPKRREQHRLPQYHHPHFTRLLLARFVMYDHYHPLCSDDNGFRRLNNETAGRTQGSGVEEIRFTSYRREADAAEGHGCLVRPKHLVLSGWQMAGDGPERRGDLRHVIRPARHEAEERNIGDHT
jgi:hypothetical protein